MFAFLQVLQPQKSSNLFKMTFFVRFLFLTLMTNGYVFGFDYLFDSIFGDDEKDIKRHVMEDSFLPFGMRQIVELTAEEVDFHLFNSHDYDKNGKLDGLEFLTAMQHKHSHVDHGSVKSFQSDITLIDSILEQHDGDRDGFLDYTEFAHAKRRSPQHKVIMSIS